ncbi:MAG TPA: hypothetical protein VGK67_41310 [Myxococcales bacterium]|jgi:hypothetical protein
MLSVALVAALLVNAAPPAKEPPMLRFGTDLRATPVKDGDKGEDPKPIQVGAPKVKVEGKQVVGELVVENTSDRAVRIVVNPYGGGFPYGGTSPFTLGFGADPMVKYAGELYPPEPPAPLAIEFPAKAKVLFTATIPLQKYTWPDGHEGKLAWGFYFAKGKPVEGEAKVKLPKK